MKLLGAWGLGFVLPSLLTSLCTPFAANAQACGPPPSCIYENATSSCVSAYADWCRKCGGSYTNGSNGPSCSGISGGGSGGEDAGAAMGDALYQLSYQFFRWLFSSGPSAQQQAQQQAMLAEIARRQVEADRQNQAEEAARLAEMYNRLSYVLIHRELPNLKPIERPTSGPGLQLMMRGSSDAQTADSGAPGFYQDARGKWYLKGINGLPGIYAGPETERFGDLVTNASGRESGAAPETASSGLQMMMRDSQSAGGQTSVEQKPASPPEQSLPGLQMITRDSQTARPQTVAATSGQSASSGAATDPSQMTPQQLADAAEAFSRLSLDQQQKMLDNARQNPQAGSGMVQPLTAGAVQRVEQQAAISQEAAHAPGLEGASVRARVGFDTAGSPPAGAPPIAGTTPQILRPDETVPVIRHSEPPAPVKGPATAERPMTGDEEVQAFLFPATSPQPSVFPADSNPHLKNPLRERALVEAEEKNWDDWATQQAVNFRGQTGEDRATATIQIAALNEAALKEYAPELLSRYQSDAVFRERTDTRLDAANQLLALHYYDDIADAHKAAIAAREAGMQKLADESKIELLTPLESQYKLHPERRAIVDAMEQQISAQEKAAVKKAKSDADARMENEYRSLFKMIRAEAVQGK